MTASQVAEIMKGLATVAADDLSLVGWEPKTNPLPADDPVLAAIIDANRVYEIPFKVVATAGKLQLWERAKHSAFWNL
jgi:hypothetical protein